MKSGVNEHGVQYTQIGESDYHCVYYIGEGVEHQRTFFEITLAKIKKIDLAQILNSQTNKLRLKK